MQLQTPVDLPKADFEIQPCARMLFVGSCFADNMGRRFADDCFRVTVNPYGVMYNPISIGHTVVRLIDTLPSDDEVDVAVLTLGTSHIYILRATGEVVDNCQKRPQNLFEERAMTVQEVTDSLSHTIRQLRDRWPQVRIILTVSPIRYKKYGFHGSQLSKATLLLAADRLVRKYAASDGNDANGHPTVVYFPAYEIVNDELRDYRFYREDMLHPTDQAVEYIWERFAATYFSDETNRFLAEWRPVKAALGHRPFNPDGEEYRLFLQRTREKAEKLKEKYPDLELCF